MLVTEEVLADEEDGIGGVVCVVVDAGGTVEVLVAVDSVADEVALDSSLRESEIDSVDPGADCVLGLTVTSPHDERTSMRSDGNANKPFFISAIMRLLLCFVNKTSKATETASCVFALHHHLEYNHFARSVNA